MPTHTTPVENGSIVFRLVQRVAEILDTPAEGLPPLEETVDTELLQRIADLRSNDAVTTGQVTFEYEGLTITVDTDGEVHLEYR